MVSYVYHFLSFFCHFYLLFLLFIIVILLLLLLIIFIIFLCFLCLSVFLLSQWTATIPFPWIPILCPCPHRPAASRFRLSSDQFRNPECGIASAWLLSVKVCTKRRERSFHNVQSFKRAISEYKAISMFWFLRLRFPPKK